MSLSFYYSFKQCQPNNKTSRHVQEQLNLLVFDVFPTKIATLPFSIFHDDSIFVKIEGWGLFYLRVFWFIDNYKQLVAWFVTVKCLGIWYVGVRLGYTNVRGRPDNCNQQNQDKTKHNRDNTRRRLRICRRHYHVLRVLNQSYWSSPHVRYTTYSHDVSTPVIKQTLQECWGDSSARCSSLLSCFIAPWEGCSPDLKNEQKTQQLLAFQHELTHEDEQEAAFLPGVGAVWSHHIPGDRFHLLPT